MSYTFNLLRCCPFQCIHFNRFLCKNTIHIPHKYRSIETHIKSITVKNWPEILREKSIFNCYKYDKLILSKMYASGSSLDIARIGTMTVDLIHDRHVEHYFKHLSTESSTENIFSIDDTTHDEDDCFTFEQYFAPRGWVHLSQCILNCSIWTCVFDLTTRKKIFTATIFFTTIHSFVCSM